jgi:hypothetical protein
VPIPNTNTVTPPPSSPTPTPEPQQLPLVHIAPAFQFNSQNEIVQFYLKETQRIENSEIAVRTPSGTILTIVKSEEDISNDNTNNLSCNGNNAG